MANSNSGAESPQRRILAAKAIYEVTQGKPFPPAPPELTERVLGAVEEVLGCKITRGNFNAG